MIYFQLFITFFKIGLFGFGGGYAMLPLIQQEIVDTHGWLTNTEFIDIVAISQMTPGPIGINAATFVGYTATGSVWGATVATIAFCLPSFIIMLLICKLFSPFRTNPYFESIFKVLRPVVVGLIASAALILITPDSFFDYGSLIIFAVAFFTSWKLKLHPIITLVAAGFSGALFL